MQRAVKPGPPVPVKVKKTDEGLIKSFANAVSNYVDISKETHKY